MNYLTYGDEIFTSMEEAQKANAVVDQEAPVKGLLLAMSKANQEYILPKDMRLEQYSANSTFRWCVVMR